MAVDTENLKTEIMEDPLGRGYTPMTDQQVLDDLYTEYRSRNRATMTSSEVFNAVDVVEFLAKADGDRNTVMQIMGFGVVNPFGKEADVFISIFGAPSVTITALSAARVEAISRAAELNLGTLRLGHIQVARA